MTAITPQADLVRHYRWLRQAGDNDAHSGNGSVRVGEHYWITPSGACADALTEQDLVPAELTAAPPAGASLDAPLHAAVYHNRDDVGAILHSHGPHALALTLDGTPFRALDFEGQAYFPQVPVLDIPYADYLQRAPAEVAAGLREHRIVIVRGHGLYAADRDLNLAYKWCSSLEHSARIAYLARQAGIT